MTYALSTKPDLKHLEQTQIFLGVPSTTALTDLRFGLYVLEDFLFEWLTFKANFLLLPHTSHIAIFKHLLDTFINRP